MNGTLEIRRKIIRRPIRGERKRERETGNPEEKMIEEEDKRNYEGSWEKVLCQVFEQLVIKLEGCKDFFKRGKKEMIQDLPR